MATERETCATPVEAVRRFRGSTPSSLPVQTTASAADLLALQRRAGNAAVCRALRSGALQRAPSRALFRDPRVHYAPGERSRAQQAQGTAARSDPGPLLPSQVFLANFAPGSSELSGTQITELRALLDDEHLASRGSVVQIIGYTDAVDTEDVNAGLRQARAESVRQFLLRNGVPASRVGPAIGAAPGTYPAENRSEMGRASNRGALLVLSSDPVPPPPPPPPEHHDPPPVPPTPSGNTHFRVRMLFAGAAAGDVIAVDQIFFEICDPQYQQSATYSYTGAGIGWGIKVPRRIPLPRRLPRSLPGGATTAGPWNDFTTRERMGVGEFGGATRFTTAGGGPWSLNYLTMCGSHPVDCLTVPKTLMISTGFTVGVGMSTTAGALVRLRDGDQCSCN